jgi:hypothetical protein
LKIVGLNCSAAGKLVQTDSNGNLICGDDDTSAGAGVSTIQENDTTIEGSANSIDFLGSDFDVTSSPAGEANIAIDYTNSGIARKNQNETVTANWILSGLTTLTNAILTNSTTTNATSTNAFAGILLTNTASFGATATSSFNSAGALTLASALGLSSGGTATTTFYNGGVVFSDGTKLTQATTPSSFFWDNTNTRFGLGTSTPWGELSVNANNIGSVPQFVVGSSTKTDFIVNYDGDVGVATTTPWGLLSINPDGIAGPSFVIGSSSAIHFLVNNGGKVGVATTTPWGLLSINPNGITGPSFVIGSSSAIHFLVNNGGKVGVATSSPAATFSVSGQALISGTTTVGALTVTTSASTTAVTPTKNTIYANTLIKGYVAVRNAGGVPTIASSFNVSSITDGGVGVFTVNWQNAFANTNYAISGIASDTTDEGYVTVRNAAGLTTTSVGISAVDDVGALVDQAYWSIIAVGAQ